MASGRDSREWTGPPGRLARLDYLQMRQQSRAEMALQAGRLVSRWQEVAAPMRRVFAEVTGWPAPVQRLAADVGPAAPQPGKKPIRTHVRRPIRPPLLYLAAVPPVRFVRIRPLTSGAKRARTADLLHAICRQHVHPRPYSQVTLLPRPRKSARVRVSCCTSVLYSAPRPSAPARALPIHQRGPGLLTPGYCPTAVLP